MKEIQSGSYLAIKNHPKTVRTGIWASIVSAVMSIGIGIFWVAHPAAAEGSLMQVQRMY
jgi:hypothetical protein